MKKTILLGAMFLWGSQQLMAMARQFNYIAPSHFDYAALTSKTPDMIEWVLENNNINPLKKNAKGDSAFAYHERLAREIGDKTILDMLSNYIACYDITASDSAETIKEKKNLANEFFALGESGNLQQMGLFLSKVNLGGITKNLVRLNDQDAFMRAASGAMVQVLLNKGIEPMVEEYVPGRKKLSSLYDGCQPEIKDKMTKWVQKKWNVVYGNECWDEEKGEWLAPKQFVRDDAEYQV